MNVWIIIRYPIATKKIENINNFRPKFAANEMNKFYETCKFPKMTEEGK